jgi:hypothetical protein
MATSDHHSEYLARAVAALTPEGRERADELLGQLAGAAAAHPWVVQLAVALHAEVEAGTAEGAPEQEPSARLARDEIDVLLSSFMAIRDGEPLDDVADWANAVVALLEDERGTLTDL